MDRKPCTVYRKVMLCVMVAASVHCASPNSVTAGELGEVPGRPEEDKIEELRETGQRETGLQLKKLRFIAGGTERYCHRILRNVT